MGKGKIMPQKSLQLYEDDLITTTERSRKEALSKNGLQQVFIQQSVTILAFKDKTSNNSTTSPDVLEPRLFLGILSEDLPIFVGAIIGATLIIVLFLLILTFWKCCCRMQLLKKKKYWLNPKDKAHTRGKHIFPSVIQSNSVLFLGLKSTQIHDLHNMEKSLEENSLPKHAPFSEKVEDANFADSQCTVSATLSITHSSGPAENGPVSVSTASNHIMPNRTSLPVSSIPVLAAPVEPTYVNCKILAQHLDSPFVKPKGPVVFPTHHVNIPSIITQCDDSQQSSPAFFHRTYYSGTFDQHSLYSCASHMGSEIDLKTCSLTWSSYNLRPSSTADCYYDIFQRASLCKKRKNRMRSDIAAAIALNRSQSTQLNKSQSTPLNEEKDTDSLVENEVEIVLDERTTL